MNNDSNLNIRIYTPASFSDTTGIIGTTHLRKDSVIQDLFE